MILQLAPSILSFDAGDYRTPVAELMRTGVDWIHFDVMDGQFVPPITFGAGLVADLRRLGDTPFEAHLMTMTPEAHFEAFAQAGCQRIVFHAEATHHAHRHLKRLREMGVQSGLAVNPGTPVEAFVPLLDEIDLALVMTVNPGWGGQAMIEPCLEKVARLRELKPDLDIEVDGGITPATVGRAATAGANVFVTGSFLASAPSIGEGVREIRAACV